MNEIVIDTVRQYLLDLLSEMELELFDIQFRPERHGWILRIYIDTVAGKDGVTLDQCSQVSRELSHYLDVEDCIDHAYYLEVSSPGLNRPLRSLKEFERYQGEMCKIRLHHSINGEKVYIGKIIAVAGDKITLEVEKGELQVAWGMLNKARLYF